jgi:hypothetical protein
VVLWWALPGLGDVDEADEGAPVFGVGLVVDGGFAVLGDGGGGAFCV